jgi:hypothetical protein
VCLERYLNEFLVETVHQLGTFFEDSGLAKVLKIVLSRTVFYIILLHEGRSAKNRPYQHVFEP